MARKGEIRLETGSLFQGRYEILGELGAGSFGRVYKARQLSTGQDVAIKILHFRAEDTDADVENQTARFRREMQLCGELSHPNIVRLIDSGESDQGVLYVVLEFVPGFTLRQVLGQERTLGLVEAFHLMLQVLDALGCAHTRGVVHRDLKPENIMITRTGARRNALVLDFGLGGFARDVRDREAPRLTSAHEIMGTPCYAAPEQLRGEPPSTRSDLYSWGLILLECLTGAPAIDGSSGPEVVAKQLGPEPVSIPTWLLETRVGRVLQVVVAKQIEKRDVTIEGLLEALGPGVSEELRSPSQGIAPQDLPRAERRQLTIVSVRLQVAETAGQLLDAEDVDQVLHAQHAVYAELVARNGGQVAGVLADRIMLAFGFPRAREDDARRAARAALDIIAEVERTGARLSRERGVHLEVQLGMHTGVVVVRELRGALQSGLYDLVGPTPERAVRLAELAAPGEILVSQETRRLLHAGFATEPASERLPVGSKDGADVFRLIGEAPRSRASDELREEAPLVGRESELARLKEAWSQARAGRGQVLLISGEAGIGKSRLLRELRREVSREAWLECSCVAESQSTPLRPISELVQSWDVDVEGLLEQHGFDLPQTMPLFAAYLSLPRAEQYAPLRLPPDRQKELALGAIAGLLLRMAEERPVVLAFEDLHWGDPTTLDLVALLVREIRSAEALAEESRPRILLLLTARPEFQPAWSVADLSTIRVSRLGRSEVERLVGARLGGRKVTPQPILAEVVHRADGIPLFVEEVTRMLVESPPPLRGHALASERLRLEIPATLRDLLAARLDTVSEGARETAQLAALLGREFRFELLRAVTQRSEDKLREDLALLESSDLLHRRRGVSSESYVFKHALVRDTAYESIVTPTRCALHRRVATVLQERFPDIERRRPDVLAQHLEAAGEHASGATYWHRAAEIALRSAAYVEAIQLLERALALLERLPESRDRTRSEIEIRSTLGVALYSSRGYGADEVGQTFTRVHELCAEIGTDVSIKVLGGIWAFFITRSDRGTVLEQLPGMRRLAEHGEDPVARFSALLGLSAVDFWQGAFATARQHALGAQAIYRSDPFQSFLHTTGYEAALFCFAWDMLSQWELGYPDMAAETGRELLAEGERARDPYSLPIALGHAAMLAIARGDAEATLAHADRLLALAQEQNLLLWFAASQCARGGALLLQGKAEEAIGPVQQGLALFQAIGVRSSYSSYLSYLAHAYLDAGRADEGLAVVREGLALCESQLARFHRPELLRLEGELLLVKQDAVAAEARFREALELAARGGARAMALRAATSLARLLRRRGENAQAKEVLQPVYGSFTEGFDTADLRRAAARLAEVS